ncbi:unnamed protein product, partial [Coregonus sp. 'balchen']
ELDVKYAGHHLLLLGNTGMQAGAERADWEGKAPEASRRKTVRERKKRGRRKGEGRVLVLVLSNCITRPHRGGEERREEERRGVVERVLSNYPEMVYHQPPERDPEKELPYTSRAKMTMINSMSKIRGQEKGLALIDAGESMRELGEVKDALDMEVKQNFLDPLQTLHDKDLKEIAHHLKKLEGRRLDFDYKKKRQGKVTDDEIKQALEKFDDTKEIAELSMFNLLESDVRNMFLPFLLLPMQCVSTVLPTLPSHTIEQVSQLAALVQAQVEYHRQCAEILTQLQSKMEDRIRDSSNKPKKEFIPKPLRTTMEPSKDPGPQIDDNWYEGMIHGSSGFFPVNYVDILVPLP